MRYLNRMKKAGDIKKINSVNLHVLAAELREFLIESLSKTGGHLASNLGVVELTLALHYVFDFSNDKIIWDVGHQSYVHKILTGRKERFNTLRQLGGLSGFPKTSESPYDCFNTGHSSTSISAGLGFCLARDLKKEDFSVVSVIGDGSLTGGLAYEGLNNAGRANTDFIVVLNDNQMSISENVGGLSKHLTDMRTAPGYLGAKQGISHILHKLPVLGDRLGRLMEKTKNGIRYVFVEDSTLFEELGFTYVGPVDGHDLEGLIKIFNRVKKIKGPVLVHVITQKGRGYKAAENDPANFHGVGSFDISTGKALKCSGGKTYTDVFAESVLEVAQKDERIVAVTAAMPDGTGLSAFKERFPERFFDVGIAESHAATFAAGLAAGGLRPVFAVYSTFLQRSYAQVLHDVCLQNLPVVFAVDRAGISGPDGETHQGIFDLSYLSGIPNLVIMAPRSGSELREMLFFAFKLNCPVAIRYPKGEACEQANFPLAEIKLGEPEIFLGNVKEQGVAAFFGQNGGAGGKRIALVSVGALFDTACEVYEKLSAEHSVTLINARFVRPIRETLLKRLEEAEYIFVIEDNIRSGGYFMALASHLSGHAHLQSFSLPDKYIEHGKRQELLQKYGLDAETILNGIMGIIDGTSKA